MNATLTDLFVLCLRLWLGLVVLVGHGWDKLAAPAEFIATRAQDFPLPSFSGWFAILAECVGGAFLVLGFRTRLSAGAIALVMLVSAFSTTDSRLWSEARELRLTLVLLALYFAVQGAGPLSLDAKLERRDRRRSPW
jgi:putative oxidoreductase